MALTFFSGPQDPSQLQNLLNQLLATMGAFVSPIPGQPGVMRPLQTGSTSTPLPTSGIVVLSTGTGAYALPKPTSAQLGQTVVLTVGSTKIATITGNFFSNKTKITMTSTAAIATAQRLPSVELFANSTANASAWRVIDSLGSVKST